MAYAIIPNPGRVAGALDEVNRNLAQSVCHYCGRSIGYEKPFCQEEIGGDLAAVHHACRQAAIERQKQFLRTVEDHLRSQLEFRGAVGIRVTARPSVVSSQGPIVRIECRETRRWVEMGADAADQLLSRVQNKSTNREIIEIAETLEGAVHG